MIHAVLGGDDALFDRWIEVIAQPHPSRLCRYRRPVRPERRRSCGGRVCARRTAGRLPGARRWRRRRRCPHLRKARQSGVWPVHTRRRQPDAIARAARQVDSNDSIQRPRGAYRAGSDGPNTATTGVPTAAARCIGPVSPVMKRSSRARTAPSVSRSRWPARSISAAGGSACFTLSTRRRSSPDPVSTMVAPVASMSRRATSANRSGSHCLIARPPLTWTPTSGPRATPSRRAALS